jgi:hypothetical protein
MKPLVIVVVGALLASGSAAAKEGVEATLLSTIPQDARAGSTLRLEWRLADVESGRPFDAGGAFVRLVGAGGVTTTSPEAAQPGSGRFIASVVVPPGGVHGIRIGIHGWSDAGGTREADELFRIVNDPFVSAWTSLARPLRVPTLGPGGTCPVTRAPRGAAYPVGRPGGTIAIAWGAGDVDSTLWGVQAVRWIVGPRYRGPVLVRGIGLDNPYRVRFGGGRVPAAELRLPTGTHDRLAYVRIREPGCYAFQVDGLSFTRSIVFRADR